MKLNREQLITISKKYGESFYLLNSNQFQKNYVELLGAFTRIYPQTNIAYSYKTNYIPTLCKLVHNLGGYAEVVSGMEYQLARSIGVMPDQIIMNGPYQDAGTLRELLPAGGIANLDSLDGLSIIRDIAADYPDRIIRVGLRCNFPVGDGVVSRFGIDTQSVDFSRALTELRSIRNVRLAGMHCHFSCRRLDTWQARVEGMLQMVDQVMDEVPDYIDLGGGIFGKMADSLKVQFDSPIPSYEEYAAVVAPIFAKHFADVPRKPILLLEPGSALVGDAMKFAAKVLGIKTVRGKSIATLLGSVYNINPTLNKKNPPLTVYSMGGEQANYCDLDFGGYTCIESDYLYKGYYGQLATGDYAVFDNVGSYSIVLKPPFILPNFSVVDCCEADNHCTLVKRQECFEDLFQTFLYDCQ